MKLKYYLLTCAVLATACLLGADEAYAQDSLIVEWEVVRGEFEPEVNALRTTIIADTLADGTRPEGRVYVLRRGGFYWLTDPVETEAGEPLVIVGQTAEQADAADMVCGDGNDDCGPAVIQRVPYDDGSTPQPQMFSVYDDLTLKNVWIMGQTSTGSLANYEPIKLLGAGKTYTFDNVIFDRNDWHHLGPDAANGDFYITNSIFRNLFGPTQIWEGLGIRWEVGADTVVVENNTFFNIGFSPLQSEAAPINYLRFNHNTLVNIGRFLSAGNMWKEAYVTNNLFVNPFFLAEDASMYEDPSRADPYTGFFTIGTLPARFGTDLERRIVLANNLHWRDDAFDAIYEAGGTEGSEYRPQPFVSDTTLGWFEVLPGGVMQDNITDVQPNLVTYPLTDDMLDSIEVYMDMLYSNPVQTPAPRWFWDPGRPDDNVTANWPLPEDFSYDTQALMDAGTDDLPLGDLNWFEDAKQTFLANKTEFVTEIEGMAGGRVTTEIVETVQAESVTAAGGAEVTRLEADTDVVGDVWLTMAGGAAIEWAFEVPEEKEYVLDFQVNAGERATSGVNLILNESAIFDSRGWGQFVFEPALFDVGNNEWVTLRYTQDSLNANSDGALTLPAGTNTLRIENSWAEGFQFEQVDVVDPATGDVVATMTAPEATNEGAGEGCAEGFAYCPVGFGWVAAQVGESVEWSTDFPSAGDYLLRVFYQAPETGATASVMLDGTEILSGVSLNGGVSDVLTPQFDVSSDGSHSLAVVSGTDTLNVDYVQVVRVTIGATDIERELPDGYALHQNYPNPFNPSTTINYEMGAPGDVRLDVFDVLGRKVATLVEGRVGAGPHTVQFDARGLASGLYFYRIETPVGLQTRKMVLVK